MFLDRIVRTMGEEDDGVFHDEVEIEDFVYDEEVCIR